MQTRAPSFSDTSLIYLHVPCTFDFNVAVTKYFAGLELGEVPLCFLISGTVSYSRNDAHDDECGQGLQIDQISWNKECKYRLAISEWQSMMEHYCPNGAWLLRTMRRARTLLALKKCQRRWAVLGDGSVPGSLRPEGWQLSVSRAKHSETHRR